jgi:hypothetical protein
MYFDHVDETYAMVKSNLHLDKVTNSCQASFHSRKTEHSSNALVPGRIFVRY